MGKNCVSFFSLSAVTPIAGEKSPAVLRYAAQAVADTVPNAALLHSICD